MQASCTVVLVGKIGRFIPFQDFDIVYIQEQILIFRYGFYEILHTVGCYGKCNKMDHLGLDHVMSNIGPKYKASGDFL